MNYAKLDAALAAALDSVTDGAAPVLPVWVELERDAEEPAEEALSLLGAGRGRIRAATLSADQVGELSDETWVHRIRLSRPLHLVEVQ